MKYHIEKQIHIQQNLADVRKYIEDFSHWSTWSPWTVLEPKSHVHVSGSPQQPGHKMSWEGTIIGSGNIGLTSFTNEKIDYDLAFVKPFKSKAKTSFSFKEEHGGTTVTWEMDSSMPFFLAFLINMIKQMIGMDFERGLKMLKSMAETGEVPATTTYNDVVNYEGFSYIGIRRTTSMEDMPTRMAEDFSTLNAFVQEKHISAEKWVAIYEKWDMKNKQTTYLAVCSDENVNDIDLPDNFVRGNIATTKAMEIQHNGSYTFLGNAWSMGMMYMRAKKMKGSGPPFEQYWNSPMETAEKDLKTSIYFPIK